jgi:hypothetical protein
MKPDPDTTAEYKDQIVHCARALAVAKNDAVHESLAPGMRPLQVEMFTAGNLDKRFQKLQDQMELVAGGFDADEFKDRIVRYVRSVPLAAYDTGDSDGERFLQWILETAQLSAVQRDLIACQQGRYAVETIARGHRMAHVHFQELRSLSERLSLKAQVAMPNAESPAAPHSGTPQLHLNPIHVWGRFETNELLGEEDVVPATVMFFPVGKEIRTAVLEADAMDVVRVLETLGPACFDDLRRRLPSAEADALAATCGDLTDIGLAAIA